MISLLCQKTDGGVINSEKVFANIIHDDYSEIKNPDDEITNKNSFDSKSRPKVRSIHMLIILN